MIKFSDLNQKGVKVESESDSSFSEDLAHEDITPLDAHQWYQNACQFLESAFGQVRSGEQLSINEAEDLMEEIVQACLQGNLPQELLIQALHGESTYSFLITNPVNVTVFAVLIARTMGLPRERLVELGLAALLHDLGKIGVSEEILYKNSTLSDQELETIRAYPHDTFKVLQALGEEYHYLAECGLHIYERLDGSGYPQGLKGDEINPYAQIVGLLDMYEAMTHNRPHREKLPHFQAIKEIIKTQKRGFHREILKALINTVSIFPLHSLVKLNSGAIGKVIQTFADQPLRPKVEIVVDAQKRRVPAPRVIDLREQPILHVLEEVVDVNLAS